MSTYVVVEVPDASADAVRRLGPDGRLEVGGFFGHVMNVRITGTLQAVNAPSPGERYRIVPLERS